MLSSPTWAERKIMCKKTRDLNAAECMIWMFKNNPGKIDIHMEGDYPRYLISFVHTNHLKFPEGWYYANDTKEIKKMNSLITVHITRKE